MPPFPERRRRPLRLRAVLGALTLVLAGTAASTAAVPTAAHAAAAGTADFRGVNWADPRDNYADDPVVPSGLTHRGQLQPPSTGQGRPRSSPASGTTWAPTPCACRSTPIRCGTSWWSSYTGAIDAATGKGFKVILGYWEGPAPQGRPDRRHRRLEHHVGHRHRQATRGNASVYFEPMNEPFGYTSRLGRHRRAAGSAALGHPARPGLRQRHRLQRQRHRRRAPTAALERHLALAALLRVLGATPPATATGWRPQRPDRSYCVAGPSWTSSARR